MAPPEFVMAGCVVHGDHLRLLMVLQLNPVGSSSSDVFLQAGDSQHTLALQFLEDMCGLFRVRQVNWGLQPDLIITWGLCR